MLSSVKRAVRRLRKGKPIRRSGPPEGRAAEAGTEFYDHRYATKPEKNLPAHRSQYYPLWAVIADRTRGRAILEVGCGAGQLAALMIEQGAIGYTGFDLSPEAVKLAKARAPEANLFVADAKRTELFAQARYSIIVCTEVLEHIEEDRELIARWPAGTRCIASVPNFPGTAHVRHFKDAGEVRARYGDLFDDHVEITTWKRARARPALFFLLDGVRR